MAKANKMKKKWSSFARSDGSFAFESLSEAQKEELYNELDSPVPTAGVRLTPAQRRLHARARRRGRPRKGKGAEVVSLSIEKGLLRKAERLAKAEGVSRSDLFSRGLRALLAVKGAA